jgi:hypothetical protein
MVLEDVAAENKNSRVVDYFTAQVRALKTELSCKDKVVRHTVSHYRYSQI